MLSSRRTAREYSGHYPNELHRLVLTSNPLRPETWLACNPTDGLLVQTKVNPTKQALLAELTQALAPLLPPTSVAKPDLPKPVAQALELLAERLLRWRDNQQARRPSTGAVARPPISEAAALAHQLQGHLQEEPDALAD